MAFLYLLRYHSQTFDKTYQPFLKKQHWKVSPVTGFTNIYKTKNITYFSKRMTPICIFGEKLDAIIYLSILILRFFTIFRHISLYPQISAKYLTKNKLINESYWYKCT